MAELKKYKMIVYSNFVEGKEEEYRDWYAGQHIHDMLNIPGFVGCQWLKISEKQQMGTLEDKKFRYCLIWDIWAEDIDAVWASIIKAREEGRITYSPYFDKATYNTVCELATNYVTAEEIKGMSVAEVRAFSGLVD